MYPSYRACNSRHSSANIRVKIYDMSQERRELVGIFSTEKKKPSAITFISDSILAVGIDRSDTGGKSGSIALVEVSPYEPVEICGIGRQSGGLYRKMNAFKKIHNIGQGLVKCIKLDTRWKVPSRLLS